MVFWNVFCHQNPKKFFLDYQLLGSHWRVVTWNFDLKESGSRKWTIEAHAEKSKNIHWEKKKTDEIRCFEDKKLVSKKKMKVPDDELKGLMNIALHSTLKYSLEQNHKFMVSTVNGATIEDFQNEARFLQWIQATLGTLMRALDSMTKDKDLILTAACFAGTTPDSQEDVLRVIVFNLDIFYYLRPDQTLQIVVFDDKNLGSGGAKAPIFQQIIKVTKPQFYDEITKLLHRMAQVGEIC